MTKICTKNPILKRYDTLSLSYLPTGFQDPNFQSRLVTASVILKFDMTAYLYIVMLGEINHFVTLSNFAPLKTIF